ncbi:MAG: iron-containing alcohol dehydrogenase [Candidatus Saccharicenans sp.]
MINFNYYQPTEIRFGSGRLNEIGKIAARYGQRGLLVTVPVFPELENTFNRAKRYLQEAGVEVAHFDQVIPNPTVEVVSEGAKLAKEFKAEVVIGLGGGSSMDTAKAIAVAATHPGTCWDYLFFRPTQPTEKTLPIIAVSTTSGTGSQVTQVAVVTNPAERNKSALFNSILYPRVAVVDPELMLSLPPQITASTGFDAFTHAFESYINPNGSPYTDLLALEAIRIIIQNLPEAMRNGSNLEVRSKLAWADTLAGLSIANAGVTLPHGIAMAMSGLYPHIPHGQALAAVYPAIMKFSWKYAQEKFAQLGWIFDPELKEASLESAASAACQHLENFLKTIGLRKTLKELGVPKEELDLLAERSLVLPDYKSHPYVVNLKEVKRLLEESYE